MVPKDTGVELDRMEGHIHAQKEEAGERNGTWGVEIAYRGKVQTYTWRKVFHPASVLWTCALEPEPG